MMHADLIDQDDLLSQLRSLGFEVSSGATAEQACGWFNEVNARADAAIDQALPVMAEAVRGLDAPQLAHLEHKFAATNEGGGNAYTFDGETYTPLV